MECQTHCVEGELVSLRQGGLNLVFGNESEIRSYSVLKERHSLAEVIAVVVKKACARSKQAWVQTAVWPPACFRTLGKLPCPCLLG